MIIAIIIYLVACAICFGTMILYMYCDIDEQVAIFLGCKDAEVRMYRTGKRSRIGKFKTKYESTPI